MRVIRALVRPIHEREDGAVLAMAAISLIVLLGMLVLTVDLGRSVAIKRQMVNGTDAAALAAAQDCAANKGGLAQGDALAILRENRDGASVSGFSAPQCGALSTFGPKQVTVNTTTPVTYYFAPLFGVDSGAVTASATAIWGPISKTRPIPITVNRTQLQGCHIPSSIPSGETLDCELAYPRNTLVEPRWGALDLSRWNEAGAAPCHVSAATLMNEISSGGWPDPLPINPAPTGHDIGFTPDCLDNGLSFSVWQSMVGRTLTFPVIDVPTSTGQGCTGADAGCRLDSANIVAFVTLKVISAQNDGSTVRLQVQWLGPQVTDGEIGNGPDYGDRAIRLVR